MAIDKLNFNGLGSASSGASSIKGALTNLGDRLMAYGANLSEQELAKQRQQNIEDNQMIQNNKENMAIAKENANQKALLNYHNAATRASTLGTMNDEQGKQLGAEFDSLASKFGSDKAGQIISDKASAFASADAAKLQSSPKLAYDRVSQLELPSGYNIDPLKLIAMKEQKLSSLQDQQSKLDDRAFKEKEFKADQEYKNASLALQRQEAANRMAERNEERREKKDLVNATIASNKSYEDGGDLIYDPVTGAYVKNVNTGVKKLDYSYGDNTDAMVKELYDKVGNKIEKAQALNTEIIPEDKLKDEKVLLENYSKTPGSKTSFADDLKFNSFSPEDQERLDEISSEKAALTTKKSFLNVLGEKGEKKDAELKIKELDKESGEIVRKYNSGINNNTMTFDDYKKNIQMSNEEKKKELYGLQKDIDSAYKGIEKELTTERGVEQKTNKFADVAEVKTKAFNDKLKQIKDADPAITDSAAVKVALDYSNKVGDNQSNIRSTSKTEGEKEEEKKAVAVEKDIENRSKIIAKELDTLNDLQKSLITGKDYDEKVADPFSADGQKIRVDDLAALINAKKVNAENKAEDLSRYRYEALGIK